MSPRHHLQRSAIAAAIAALATGPAVVRAQSAPPPAAAAASQPGAESAKPSAAAVTVIEVTAQKVRENPQRVPLSLTAIGGAELASSGVVNATALRNQVTGLAVVEQGPGAAIQIRGVGSNPGGGNIDPSVAFGIDGVYQSRASSAFGAFYDLERVEVLKGPQGTLYGRNATVGAVNVISRRPSNRQEGEVTFELGNYDLVRAAAVVNVPLSDTLKFRAAVQGVQRKGYLSDGYNDADDKAGRFKLLYEPNKDLSVLLTADTHHKSGNGQGTIFTGKVSNLNADGTPRTNPFAPWTNANLQTHTPARDNPDSPWSLNPAVSTQCFTPGCFNTNFGPGLNNPSHVGTGHAEKQNAGLSIQNDGLGAEITYNLGGNTTLTVLPSWRRGFVTNQGYTGGNLLVPAYSVVDQTQRSLEMRLAGQTGALKWIGGAFYLREDAPTLLVGRSPNSAALTTGTSTYTDIDVVEAESKALFGQATWALRPELRLTAGLRYTKDNKHQEGTIYCRNGLNVDGSGTPCTTGTWSAFPNNTLTVNTSYADSAVNYKLGADYDLAKDVMLYGSLSTGYKAGGLNMMPDSGTATSRATFKPEDLNALALGFKSRLLGGRLQLNGELFYWQYKNQQVAEIDQLDPTASGTLSPAVGIVFINNPGTAKIKGLDLDAVYMLTDSDRISAALSLLHARNGSFVINATRFVTPTPFGNFVAPLEAFTDVSGKEMPFAPKVQFNLGWQHFFDLASGATVTLGVDAQYQSAHYVNYHLFSPEFQKAFTRGNLSLSYISPDSKLTLTGWVRNVSNEAVITRGAVGGGGGGVAAAHFANIGDPRTLGLTVNVKF